MNATPNESSDSEPTNPEKFDLTSRIVLYPSLFYFWPSWLLFVAAFVGCFLLAEHFNEVGLPTLASSGARIIAWLPFLMIFYIIWKKYDTRCVLDTKTITSVRGLLSFRRYYVSTEYSSIRGVSARQTMIGMLFNFADIAVGTAETHEKEIVLRGTRRPRYYVSLIYARMGVRGNAGKQQTT